MSPRKQPERAPKPIHTQFMDVIMTRLPGWILPHIILMASLSGGFAQVALPVAAEPSARPSLPLAIEDQRPDWERHSKDCAVDFVALEDCVAPPWNLLADALQRATSSWADPPCRATLELLSFRVVVKPQAADERSPFAPLNLKGCSGIGGGPAKAIGLVVLVTAVTAVEGVYWLGRGAVEGVTGCRRTALGPPYTLGDAYQSGITCEVRGRLVLHWSDGRTQQTEVVGVANGGPRDKDAPTYLGDDIGAMIQCALRQFVQDWLGKNALQPVNP